MLGPDIPVFDGDKEFAKLKIIFDSTDSGTLYDAVNGHIFEDWKTVQLNQNADCAFETNFRSSSVMDSVHQFKSHGYETNLHFFGLDVLQSSIKRVQLRVAEGGHNVSLENINANFEEGLKHLSLFSKDFDRVNLVQNFAEPNQPALFTPLLQMENDKVIDQAAEQPDWVKQFLKVVTNGKRKGLRL
jgi:predicted ABC-type ATPase